MYFRFNLPNFVFFVAIFVNSSIKLFGQVEQSDPYCSTPDLDSATAVNLPYYNNNQILDTYLSQNGYDDLEYISFPSPATRVSTFLEPLYLIPLNIYIYRDDSNNPNSSITEADARNFVCMVNEIYRDAETAVQFYTNRVEFDPDDNFNSGISTGLNVYNMWANKRLAPDNSKGINVHFIRYNSAPEDNSGRASLPFYPVPPFSEYSLYVRTHNNPSGGQRTDVNIVGTFAHELGHTLGLLHTHHPGRLPSLVFNEQNGTISNGCYQESVSRTRENKVYQGCFATGGLKKCEINGDFLCDTDADPRQSNRVTACTYNHPAGGDYRNDNWGVLWAPPTNNVMSYTTPNCRDEFSRGQIGIMWMEMPHLENVIDYDIPEIQSDTGPLCYGSSRSFTLDGTLPNDAVVTWEVEPAGLVNQSTGTGFTANISPASSSSASLAQITFTLTGPANCYIARIQKSFQVNKISPTQISVTGQPGVCPGGWYTYYAKLNGQIPSGVSFQWIKPNNWNIVSQSASSITLSIPNSNPDGGTVRVRFNNGCGFSEYSGITVYPLPCGGGYYSVYPNPSSNLLTIELVEDESSSMIKTSELLNTNDSISESDIQIKDNISLKYQEENKVKPKGFEIEILDNYGKIIFSISTKDKKLELDISALPRDIYVLKIISENNVETRHIQIN